MKAGVPGHVVIVASRLTFMSLNLDIPKSVTLARVPAMSRTLLLERSRWMIPLEWRKASA